MNVYEYMNVSGPITYVLVLLVAFTNRIQLKAKGEVCFLLFLMGPDPHSSWFLDLSVKWYDNDDAKGVNFLQGKFHSFHLVATIVSYLTKAPTSLRFCEILFCMTKDNLNKKKPFLYA